MIKFRSLIHELHSSIKQAANEVEAQGIKHINKFFEIVEIPTENVTDLDDESIQKVKTFIDSDDTEAALSILKNHNEKLASNNQVRRVLKPKTMQMAFPDKDHNGPKISYVDVPIITLTPISSQKIQEVSIKANLEVTANDQNELFVAFPKQAQGGIFSKSQERNTSNVEIEIKLQGGETPEGLQKLIEGYERSLRAQIPG
ncbi:MULTISPECIES: DUF2589 domain-containing protein [Pseudoalteromonas]|jgi:hypothetical protein|uniref:DUF2589 domain-containing protein n=1 Tax=Pseudoalteromonas aliena SW19 TaxID=1314866 RepID=A0ABR9DZC9_9GAMM|nr:MULTISPECIES: DUF2589 domain-containing protein [Pseudoalteromonas]MBB1384655.1 DUF2589 domain-containing protein [Pseudoalteromonas sp. SG45-5]MBB1392646.1 DUF2589 domain-containing protein [Pseudoalteromonas sp. SG44-4]MBB1447277.1 DUF2589 domain-containing protein [Pseudoalteromonas sp. SG41-6]MBE0359732.1 hypothetical protein [Pseudoalteromonas aliena SW19]TMN97869.1 hypothetical protein CWB66_16770 [Pseudoalteromonas sp. S558]